MRIPVVERAQPRKIEIQRADAPANVPADTKAKVTAGEAAPSRLIRTEPPGGPPIPLPGDTAWPVGDCSPARFYRSEETRGVTGNVAADAG